MSERFSKRERTSIIERVSSVDRLDVADAATAGGEDDEVLREHGDAVAPAAPPADSLPGADDAAL